MVKSRIKKRVIKRRNEDEEEDWLDDDETGNFINGLLSNQEPEEVLAFMKVAVPKVNKEGNTMIIDVRPEATRPYGFDSGNRVITPSGLGTAIGLDIKQRIVLQIDKATPPSVIPAGRNRTALPDHQIRPIRTREDVAFLTIAVEVKAKDGTSVFVDVREQTTVPLGFRTKERLFTPRGFGTAIGIDIDKNIFLQLDQMYDHILFPCTSRRDLEDREIYPIRTKEEKAFAAIAVEVPTKNEDEFFILDVRPQTTKPMGFLTRDRMITPLGLGTALGFDIHKRFALQLDCEQDVTFVDDCHSRQYFEEFGYRVIRTQADKDFMAIAEVYKLFPEFVFYVDRRPATTLPLGFRTRDRVLTRNGPGDAVGFDIAGNLIIKLDHTDTPLVVPDCKTKRDLLGLGIHPIHTDADKAFAKIAVSRKTRAGDLMTLDVRNESMSKMGFVAQERALTPGGLGIAMGIDINGHLMFDLDSKQLLCVRDSHTTKEFYDAGYYPIRTKEEKDFIKVAGKYPDESGRMILLDCRPETLKQRNLIPNERFSHPTLKTQRGIVVSIVGLDICGRLFLRQNQDASVIGDHPFKDRDDFNHYGYRSVHSTNAQKSATSHQKTTQVPKDQSQLQQTVVLASGARYTGGEKKSTT